MVKKTQDIEDLRKQIAAESILNPNTALSSAEKSLSLEDMSEEQKWAFVAESIMKNPEGLVVREITREDQDILVQMRHPNDGLSDATPVTSPDENVALPAPTPEKPQRTGLLGRFQQWQENRAKAREEKRAAKKTKKRRAQKAQEQKQAAASAARYEETLRARQAAARRHTYRQIARLLEVRRALSEETRSKLNRPSRRWQEG
jgi:hypothetical protein